ncbi:response regulator transcription factor [Paenibacillus physcomitrellae]|uniref:DNA-binding response regulator n=1 Tax=Paenibacillus physcomitrellae TaxID=1619311 RepID=A0ABQ1GBE9_9BACL|nr:response regulator transcription factor [Paenibacillus physcomitrellae]GGA40415.1 hypothetical protein GCM10010917_27150 [Paenibacillus physcomitrellae]
MYKVILVEDEIFARQGLRNLIDWNSCGYEVVEEADNGEEALGLIEQIKPELVITDIRMPVLDGLGLIQTVRDAGDAETKFMIISGYGDFQYAQKAIKFGVKDFILKPIDEQELSDSLSRLSAEIGKEKQKRSAGQEQKALTKLLRGEAAPEEVEEIARMVALPTDRHYGYLIAEMNDLVNPLKRDAEAKQLRAFRHAIIEEVAAWNPGIQPFHLHEHRVGVYSFPVCLDPAALPVGLRPPALEEMAARIGARLNVRFEQPIYLYAGDGVQPLAAINHCYLTAIETMQYKYAAPDLRTLTYGQMTKQPLRYIEFEAGIYANLLEQMEEGNREAMLEAVDSIFAEIQHRAFAPEAVHNVIARLVFGVIGSISAMQGDERELHSLEAVLQWRNYPVTLQGLQERFRHFIEESAEMAVRLRRNYVKGDIMKIKSYIERHYNEDISLKSIAARFFMNPVYLGQLFKKTFGVYFNDFLLQIRVDNAKRLLRQTELRVYEVARHVGFDNADYFVCKFEKVEGRTPTAYRNQISSK